MNSTTNNANSRLLRLPQELKICVYELVFGGQLIHIQWDVEKTWFSCRLCQAKFSEKEALEIFAASKGPWFSTDIRNRHDACYDSRMIQSDCHRCPNQLETATESHAGLSLVLLRCCRQIYQEARSIIFSANTLSFTDPFVFLYLFIRCMDSKISVEPIRRLHLDLVIRFEVDEEDLNETCFMIAKHFKSLQHVYIDIEQRPLGHGHLKKWQFEKPAESSFLGGLRKLRDLKLRTATVIVSDPHILHSGIQDFTTEEERQYRWTMAQKQEWAQYMRRVLLRQEDQEPATGEGV